MTLASKCEGKIEKMRSFFMGRTYPLIVGALVLIGSISGLEYFLNFIVTALVVTSLVVSDSVKPLLMPLCTYVFQISLPHAPKYPTYSDYYITGWRLPVSIVIIASVVFAVVFFIVKNKIYKRVGIKNNPILIPLAVLSLAFLTNGILGGAWVSGNLLYALINIGVFAFVFLIIYHGFSEEEETGELVSYVTYLTLLISFILIGELGHLFLTSDSIFIDGSINKVGVALGWGIWNLVGVSISMLIPMLFYGAMTEKYPWLYFGAATASYIASVLTMSRNALVFATLAYGACVIISCFVGKNKRVFRVILATGIALVIIAVILLFGKIRAVLGDYFERGFSDNGRYALWRAAFDNFLSAPVFGKGFLGFDVDTSVFGPLPKQAHNTIFQLLSATGLFGFFAYAYYRFKTAVAVVRRPSLKKTMMALGILVILGGSLLDNFVFNIYPMFYYNVLLALIIRESA